MVAQGNEGTFVHNALAGTAAHPRGAGVVGPLFVGCYVSKKGIVEFTGRLVKFTPVKSTTRFD